MPPRLEWREQPRTDLISIIDYISDDNPDAAERLRIDIDRKVAMLPLHPRLYKLGRVVGTRETIVRRHYVVVYAEQAESVTVLRVLHASRQWPP